ncbi:MAG TPA: hypothetical protein VGL57_07025 [Solirubrobacteraceae bacterium]|jgi:hypothetical protein
MLDRKSYRYAITGLAVALGIFLIGVSTIAALGHAVPKELWAVGTALGGGLLGVLVPPPQATPGSKPVAESSTVQNAASTAAAQALGGLAAQPQPAKTSDAETAADASARVQRKAEAAVEDINSPENLSLAIAAASVSPGAGAAGGTLAAQHSATAADLEAKAQTAAPAERDELQAQASVYGAAARAALAPGTLTAAKAAVQAAPKGNAQLRDYAGKLLPPLFVFVAALLLGTALTVGWIDPKQAYRAGAIKEGSELLALAIAAGGAIVGVLAPSPGQKTPSSS